MINLICTIALMLIFSVISGIHFYWVFGGKWGGEAAIPQNKEGKKVLNPKKIDTVVVALIFLFIAFFYFDQLSTNFFIHSKISILKWIFPILFILRAIGEFHYVGFFKRVKGTKFAYYDTVFYSPLCLVIVLLMAVAAR